MQKLVLDRHHTAPLKILCLGAHCDDIEIGCGGTMLKLIEECAGKVSVYWQVLSSNDVRASEARTCADLFLEGADQKRIDVGTYRDGFFPAHWTQIKEQFENVKKHFNPDIIFTHYRDDRHQDHRVVSDLTWNTYRNHLILEYEIPKYDGDLGAPNVFAELGEAHVKTKTRHILDSFQSQRTKHWLTEDTLLALMRIRGVECSSNHAYAEAFYGRKITL